MKFFGFGPSSTSNEVFSDTKEVKEVKDVELPKNKEVILSVKELPTYKPAPCRMASSAYRKERVIVNPIHVGEMIRLRLLKRVDNALLRKEVVDEPEDKVMPSQPRVFNPARVSETENDKK